MTATATPVTALNDHLDARDLAMLAERLDARHALRESANGRPLTGDKVRFTDGVERWFSHDHGPELGIQTSVNGSFHFHDSGHLDFSGSLDRCVKDHTLTRLPEVAARTVWFFHHGWVKAHNGVNADVLVPVWASSQTSVEAHAANACTGCGTPVHGYPTWRSSLDGSTHCPDGRRHAGF